MSPIFWQLPNISIFSSVTSEHVSCFMVVAIFDACYYAGLIYNVQFDIEIHTRSTCWLHDECSSLIATYSFHIYYVLYINKIYIFYKKIVTNALFYKVLHKTCRTIFTTLMIDTKKQKIKTVRHRRCVIFNQSETSNGKFIHNHTDLSRV